ncbi:MAG TPA: hypothetical protein PKC70_14555 [Cellvibrionaceae bacterium]|nr:hypothetical protein [Cellvibrionaceae bacterium]
MKYITTKVTGTVHPRIDIRVYRTIKRGILAKNDRLSIYRVDTKDRFFEYIEFNGKRIEIDHPAYFFVTDGTTFYALDKSDHMACRISKNYSRQDILPTIDIDDFSSANRFSFGMAPGGKLSDESDGYIVSGPEVNFFHNMTLPSALELQRFVIDWTASNTSYGEWVGGIPDAVTYYLSKT